MLAVIMVGLLGQTPGVLVSSTSRQGIATASANELLGLIGAPLKRYPAAAGPQDLTTCKRKLPCLVKAAKQAPAAWLVAVESARVVNQVIVKVSLLSIEEDGRTVASTVVEGPEQQVRAALGAAVEKDLTPHLERAYPPPHPPPAVVVTPPPPPLEPAPPPPNQVTTPAVSVVEQRAAAPTSGLRTAGLIIGSVGLAGLVGAGVLGGLTLDAVAKRDARCPPGQQCNDPRALALHDQAAFTQDLGVLLAAGAGAAAVTGAVIFFLGAPAGAPAVSLVATPGGAHLSFSSSL